MREKPKSTNTSQKLRASNLIVLVESEIRHKILHKNIEKNASWKPFLAKNVPGK